MKINGDLLFFTETGLVLNHINLGPKDIIDYEHLFEEIVHPIQEMIESTKELKKSFKFREYDINISRMKDFKITFVLITTNEKEENIKKALYMIIREYNSRFEFGKSPFHDIEYFDLFKKDIISLFRDYYNTF
ncbi:MAG: hypothetical protein JXA99_08445 [Candidatus Lokiarchaeota archaeon]|nr:hypothetical protein [Candidatus Lokiarchaeota archaeon]